MGSPKEILAQAELRHNEGYTSAKLKVNNLSFNDASKIIRNYKVDFIYELTSIVLGIP